MKTLLFCLKYKLSKFYIKKKKYISSSVISLNITKVREPVVIYFQRTWVYISNE